MAWLENLSSEIPFLDNMGYGHLPGCATSDAAEDLKKSCNTYCGDHGELDKRDFATKPAPECHVSGNIFPPNKKVCSVSITAGCNCTK